MFVWARQAFAPGHPARRWATWSLVFILTEALLGASLVLLGHVARNESVGRVYSLATHSDQHLPAAGLARPRGVVFRGKRAAARTANRTFSLALAGPLIALVLVAVAGAITALGDTLFPSHTLAEGVRDDFSSTASFLIRLADYPPVPRHRGGIRGGAGRVPRISGAAHGSSARFVGLASGTFRRPICRRRRQHIAAGSGSDTAPSPASGRRHLDHAGSVHRGMRNAPREPPGTLNHFAPAK